MPVHVGVSFDGFVSTPEAIALAERAVAAGLRRLCAVEAVAMNGDFVRLAGARLAFQPKAPIPIYIAAIGPDMLRLAGRIGDGVVLSAGLSVQSVQQSIAICRAAAEKEGRGM